MLKMMTVNWQAPSYSEKEIPSAPKVINSIGYVLREDENLIVLAQGFESAGNGGISDILRTLSIPKRSIINSFLLGLFNYPTEQTEQSPAEQEVKSTRKRGRPFKKTEGESVVEGQKQEAESEESKDSE